MGTDGRYQVHYLPASLSYAVDKNAGPLCITDSLENVNPNTFSYLDQFSYTYVMSDSL